MVHNMKVIGTQYCWINMENHCDDCVVSNSKTYLLCIYFVFILAICFLFCVVTTAIISIFVHIKSECLISIKCCICNCWVKEGSVLFKALTTFYQIALQKGCLQTTERLPTRAPIHWPTAHVSNLAGCENVEKSWSRFFSAARNCPLEPLNRKTRLFIKKELI